jgi:hypothetical protein
MAPFHPLLPVRHPLLLALASLLLAATPQLASATQAQSDPNLAPDPLDTLTVGATFPAADAEPDDPNAKVRNEADLSAASGRAALKDANADPQQAVAAVLAFTHALKLYQSIGDGNRVTEMQAQLFWCKKNMNTDALALLAQKGAAGPAQAGADDARTATDVMNTTVPEAQAQDYFDAAAAFRKAHPDDHYLNAIRFNAVAACFADAKGAPAKAIVAKANAIAEQEREAYDKNPPPDAAQGISADKATAPGAAGTVPPPPPASTPSPAAAPAKPAVTAGQPTAADKAAWGDKLLARVREDIARKRPPRFTCSVIHEDVEIDAADQDGTLELGTGDSKISWAWKRIPDGDRTSLAVGMVRDAVPGDHCIAAFYLFLAGKSKEANQQLLKVGAPGDDVRALFGLPPR